VSGEPPIDNGPSSLLDAQAIEIAELKAEVERLQAERDDADRRAGAAERENAHLRDSEAMRNSWFAMAKEDAGYGINTSFDVVWIGTMAKVRTLTAEVERLRKAMAAVASMPGREWLAGQLALGEALQGGGENLDYVLRLTADEASDAGDAQ
jgi:outer membrane murein-binding lipoprotein Lpp